MTTSTGVLDNRVMNLVAEAANEIKTMFGRFVDIDDVKQLMCVWCLEHADKVPELARGSGWYLKRRLKDAAIKYGRQEKAQLSGYCPDDEYFYSLYQLTQLLPDAMDDLSTTPQTGPTDGGRLGEDTTMEWETMVADVRVGLDRLGYTDFNALRQLVHGLREPNEVAVQSALLALQHRLGGRR